MIAKGTDEIYIAYLFEKSWFHYLSCTDLIGYYIFGFYPSNECVSIEGLYFMLGLFLYYKADAISWSALYILRCKETL